MLSFPTIAASLALLTGVSALPASASPPPLLEARKYLECPTGYWYSKCGTTDGCFNYDPCSGSAPPPPPPPPAGCSPGRIIGPDLIDLPVGQPDAPVSLSPGQKLLAVFRDDTKAHRRQDQVALFRGIPAAAKKCFVGWRQNGSPARVFAVEDAAGRVAYQPLPAASLPAPVTYRAVRALLPAGAPERSIDFTNWDILPEANDHLGGEVDCAESIYVYLTLAKDIQHGGVSMQGISNAQGSPESQQGVYIGYTC